MDWNQDGKLDLISGDTKGEVTLFLNTGTAARPVLAAGVKVEADGKPITPKQTVYKMADGKYVMENGNYAVEKQVAGNSPLSETYSKIHAADWNGDGLADLLIGQDRTMVFYKNVGKAKEPRLAAPVELAPPQGKFPSRPSPCVADWDGDGVQDLLVGTDNEKVLFYRNAGSNKKPELEAGRPVELTGDGFEKGIRCRACATDWNNDGKLDLLVGNFSSENGKMGGNVWLFLRK